MLNVKQVGKKKLFMYTFKKHIKKMENIKILRVFPYILNTDPYNIILFLRFLMIKGRKKTKTIILTPQYLDLDLRKK